MEALPRQGDPLREALDAAWDRMKARGGDFWPWGALVDVAVNKRSVARDRFPTWHTPGRRLLLLIGAKGLGLEYGIRRLWITAVDKWSRAYTLSLVQNTVDSPS